MLILFLANQTWGVATEIVQVDACGKQYIVKLIVNVLGHWTLGPSNKNEKKRPTN